MWFWLGLTGYLLSSCVPVILYLWKQVPRYIPVLAELLITGGLYTLLPEVEESVFAFFQVPVLTLGYMCRNWHALWAVVAICLLPVLVSGGIPDMPRRTFIDGEANLAILFGIGFCFQKLVTSYQQINGMYGIIQEQNQTLEVYAKQIERLTLAEERNRLSRDLHDTVGHTFTTTIMGMDAVYYLIDQSPQEAKNNLRELLHVTRDGLDEVRQHIHQIASDKDKQSLAPTLEQIGSEFALHTGTQVDLDTVGAEYPVSEQVRLTFIRCLQESLTNAKKHGRASRVKIELAFEPEMIHLRIADNGTGAAALTMGFGLQTMTERMANLNGTLQISSSPSGGTVIECTVPIMQQVMMQMKREGA